MHAALISVTVYLAVISSVRSQKLVSKSQDPISSVKEFAEGLKQQWWQGECILEKYGSNHQMRTELLSRAISRNASDCDVSLEIFLADLLQKKIYAIRMFDAWGKIESGIITGNFRWIGRYKECTNSHTAQFSGKYFYLLFGTESRAGFGVCLPSTCTTTDAEQISYPLVDLLNIDVTAYHPEQPTEFTAVDIIGIVILSLLGCLVIAGTIYEFYLDRKETTVEELPCIVDDSEAKEKFSVWETVILSFSFTKNTKAIFDTTVKEGSINVLHGLRFLSITWVILGHTFSFGTIFVDNGVDAAYYYLTSFSFQAIGNGTLSVDSFFFLSGLLAAYLGLKEMARRKGKINVPLMYAYRYLRLTPAYALCILVFTGIYSKFGDGPFWPQTVLAFQKPCQSYWWTNLLYINNLYPASIADECLAWGWYLANDMQFFLILPLLLIVMYRRPIVGMVVLSFIVIIGMTISGLLSAHYEQQPPSILMASYFYPVVPLMTMVENEGDTFDYSRELVAPYSANATTPSPPPMGPSQSDIFWSDTYAKPWCRMDVYFIGVLAGLFLYSTNRRIRMNKIAVAIGWITASATAMAVIYGPFNCIKDGRFLSISLAAFYNAVFRPVWAFCLMWLVVACSSGYGGPVNTFLSWKVFIPLSRLSYCVYLVHPAVIYYVYGAQEDTLHFSITLITTLFAGIVLLSFAIAFILSILIEMPMLGITKAMFGKGKAKSSSTSTQYTYQIKL